MKPRFSIFTLLVVTTYAAVAMAGLREPWPPWTNIVVLLWVFIFCVQLLAAFGHGSNAAFGKGFVIAALLSLVVTQSISIAPFPRSHSEFEATQNEMTQLHGSVVAGYIGGGVALWFCHRRERRANQEKLK